VTPLAPGDPVRIIGTRTKGTFKGYRDDKSHCAVLTVADGGFRFVAPDRLKREKKR
jgi:hypothetical protein